MPVQLMSEDDKFDVTDAALGLADGDPDTVYTLRPITRETYREIARKHTTKVPNKFTRSMEDKTDWEAVGEDLLDHALVAWDGIILKGGQPAPCDRPNKLKLDGSRTSAILEKAGLSQVKAAEVARVTSFRQTG